MKRVLLIIVKIIGLCILIPLCIMSIVFLFTPDFGYALFLLLLCGVPSFFIFRSFKKTKKQHTTNEKNVNHNKTDNEHIIKLPYDIEIKYSFQDNSKTNNANQNQSDKTKSSVISLFVYSNVVKNQSRQLLESIYNVETTKNLDTLEGRMRFINKMYDNFIPASKFSTYQQHIVDAIDTYKVMYYDRVLTENQISLLLYPNLEDIQLFYADCIVHCYERYVKFQTAEMNKLKTSAAKERRKEDMIKKGYSAKYLFKTYELPDIGHLDSIESIRKQFYSYKQIE